MEGNELNPISSSIALAAMKTVSCSSSLCSHPLFCTIVALWSLILLYVPHLFLRIAFSPVLIITGTLLLTLLRVGAAQRNQVESRAGKEECATGDEDRESIPDANSEPELGFDPDPCFEESFVEWNVRAPLEVIYEEYEGDEDNEGRSVVGHPTLSLYYPDSDSDSSSDGGFPAFGGWDSPENICFRWDEEDREGLIEIALDGKKRDSNKKMVDFQGEEENLIEIDISPSRSGNSPVMD